MVRVRVELITPDLDGDLDPDIVIGGAQSAVDSETLYSFVNQSGENPMVLVPPTALTRTASATQLICRFTLDSQSP